VYNIYVYVVIMCALGVKIDFVILIGVYILICFEHCWWKSILIEKKHSLLSYMWFAYRNAIRINECVDSGTGAERWFLRRSSVRHRDNFSYERCFVSGPPYKAISPSGIIPVFHYILLNILLKNYYTPLLLIHWCNYYFYDLYFLTIYLCYL